MEEIKNDINTWSQHFLKFVFQLFIELSRVSIKIVDENIGWVRLYSPWQIGASRFLV